MIEGGYYIKARKIQNSKIAVQPPHVREIWDWLLKEANHKPMKYAGFKLERGQLFRTYKQIREELHWMVGWRKMMYSENQTKKAMKFLRENQMIATTKELGGVLITICNYAHYQNPKNYERTNESTDERTIEEPLENQPLPDNNKNNKKEKNVEEEKNDKNRVLLSQVDESTLDQREKEHFQIAMAFWQLIKSNLTELNISVAGIENAEYKSWIDPIRLLMDNDKRSIEEIREVFSFLKDDDFWKEQIRSTSKLRKKNKEEIKYFEVLLIKSRNEQRKQHTAESQKSGVSENYKNSILERLLHSGSPEEMQEN